MSDWISLIGPATVAQMCEAAGKTPPGAFVEIGVYKGGSARALADVAVAQGRELHLFDTFTGMPIADERDSHKVGDFADTDEATVRALIPEAVFHVGVFPATAPADMGPIAFLRIDADQYQSYMDAIAWATPLMAKGGLMWFDDCGVLPSADRAVLACFGDRVDRRSFAKWVVRF